VTARILVTNVEERASLAACRSLAAAGYTVIGAASSVPAAGLRSRACTHRLVVPDPRADGPAFLEAIDEAYRRYRADAFLPAVDAALLALLEHPVKLPLHAAPGSPKLDSLLTCLDKLALGEAAAAVGLPTPPTIHCQTPEDVAAAGLELGFPLLVKPRTSVVGRRGERRQQTGIIARNDGQLMRVLAASGYPCLVQRFVEHTTVYSFGGVVADARLLGSCFARYRRTWPADVGSAACAETIEPPPGLSERVLEIVTRLGWEGIFELEFVGRDGPTETIDFNPRLYGSIALAISAGANLPALWCDRLLGREAVLVTARPGYLYRWEEAELRFLLSRLLRGRLRSAAAVLRPRRRTTHAVFRLRDPLPLLAEALRVPVRLIGKTRGRLRRGPAAQPPVLVLKEPQ
jgi:carbamoylphosphate synthase large subunit